MLKSLFRKITTVKPGMSEGYTGEKARNEDPWEELYAAQANKEILQGRVKGVEKDTLVIDIGTIRGVITEDEIGEPRPKRLTAFVGAPLAFKIKRIDRANNEVQLSRKEALTEMSQFTMKELKRDCAKLIEIQEQLALLYPEDRNADIPDENLPKIRELTAQARKEGPVRTGTVRTVVEEGAYLDVGGVSVFLPRYEINWARVEDAREYLQPGESFDIKIIRVDFETMWMRASLKALLPDPWETAHTRYVKGGIYAGEVQGTTQNGNLRVELEPGVIVICKYLPINNLEPGTTVRVRIALINKEGRIMIGNIAGESRWIS